MGSSPSAGGTVTAPAAVETAAGLRTTDDIAADTRQARCTFCNPGPGDPCRNGRGMPISGMHLARYFRALAKQLITQDDLTLILALAGYVDAGTVVPVMDPPRFRAPALDAGPGSLQAPRPRPAGEGS